MLLPLPEREEIVEEEPELPESIQVSELPELDLPEPEPEPGPVFVPTPEPEAPLIVQPPPVVQQPVVVQPEPQPTEPLQTQPLQPQPITPDPPTPDPPEKQPPVGKNPNPPVGTGSPVRKYVEQDRASTDYLSAFTAALGAGVFSMDGAPITYEPIREGTLSLTLPSGDNCFDRAEPVDDSSVKLNTSLGIVVRDDGAQGLVDYVTLAGGTGYIEANDIINDTARDSEELKQAVEAWTRAAVGENGAFSFEPEVGSAAYLIWNVEVTFTDHSCPSPAV